MKRALQRKYTAPPVESLIRAIRGQKVILDRDLAILYDVETKILNQAVRRNLERFPEDFMFQLSFKEAENLMSQIVTSNSMKKQLVSPMRSQIVTASKRNTRYRPFVFTEHGIAMLSSVLRSPRAIQMNILIIRAFVRLRELITTNKDLAVRVEKLEREHKSIDSVIEVLIEDIEKLGKEIRWIKNPPLPKKHPIGFVGSKDSQK